MASSRKYFDGLTAEFDTPAEGSGTGWVQTAVHWKIYKTAPAHFIQYLFKEKPDIRWTGHFK